MLEHITDRVINWYYAWRFKELVKNARLNRSIGSIALCTSYLDAKMFSKVSSSTKSKITLNLHFQKVQSFLRILNKVSNRMKEGNSVSNLDFPPVETISLLDYLLTEDDHLIKLESVINQIKQQYEIINDAYMQHEDSPRQGHYGRILKQINDDLIEILVGLAIIKQNT